MPEQVLITGSAGFIGKALLKALDKTGHKLWALCRYDTTACSIDTHAAYISIDIRSKKAVEHIIKTVRPTWVFHLASYGNRSEHDDAQQIMDTNIGGTLNLLRAAGKVSG